MKTHRIHTKGFTLIEMLVSVAIFSVVMVMALGALLSLSTADRKAQALKSAIDNLNFGLDSMSRSIRTGYGYHCGSFAGQDCSSGSNTFFFTSSSNVVTAYQLSTDPAICNQTGAVGCIAKWTATTNAWLPITSPDVIIKDLSAWGSYLFYVTGSTQGTADNRQPLVIVTLSGYAQVSSSQQSAFNLQTSITQRLYDQ